LHRFQPQFLAAHASAQAQTGGHPQMSSPEGLALLHKMQAALGGADERAGAVWSNTCATILTKRDCQ